MYRVLCDGLPIYDLRDENLVLIDPKLDLEVNKAGSFSFKMPPQHPQYELPQKMLSCIQVFQDEEEVFNGRITECKIDFYNRKHFTCEGQLAYLNDSIQRPAEYHDMTVRGYLESLITSHNEQVKKDRQFKVGIVTVTDNNDSLYRYTNYNSTMKEIKEDLVDDLGGYLRVRNVNGTAYLDYISDYDNVSTQSIEFGENLLDFSRNTDVSDIATVFIPLGAKLEESPIAALEQRLTIESVNNGSDSLVNLDAVKKFGYITKTITWDEVTTPKMLLYKANKYIADYQWDSMTLEVNAVDMHWTDADIEQFKLGDKIKVHSSLHGLDRYFPLSKMSIQLNNLYRSKFTLGTVVNTKLTAKSQTISNTASKAVETIPVPSAIVKQAVDQAAALITAATHGHVVTTANEQLIMDTNDVNTARKVWRWNLNGLGYSSAGYNGTYKTAITMDGQIVGERLVGGSVSAEKLDINYRNQVIKEIADAEESARSDAENYTDGELKKYYTKSEVETSIKTLEDSVLLSAKETAEQYVDGKLKNYSTSAQINVKTDSIETEVRKKVGKSEIVSIINQSAEEIKIAANKISLEGIVTVNDRFKVLSDGSIECTNGKFTGTITGSKITGSTINITDSKWCTIDLDASGLRINANKYTDIFGHQGGKLVIGTTASILEPMFSPICFYPASGGVWNMPLADGCNKFRFVWNVMSSSYVEIQTLYGAFGLTAWSSDKKLKKNIVNSEISGVAEIMKIPHYAYDWIDKDYHVNCGYVAQDMENVNKSFVLKIPQKDEKGKFLGYNYQIDETNIIPVITKSIQELVTRVIELEKKYEQ